MTLAYRRAAVHRSLVSFCLVAILLLLAPARLDAQCPFPGSCCPECSEGEAEASYAFLCPSNASDPLTVDLLLRDAFGRIYDGFWPQCRMMLLCADGTGAGVEPVADTDANGETHFQTTVADVLGPTGCCPSMIVRLDYTDVTCDIPVQQLSPPTEAQAASGGSAALRVAAAPNPAPGAVTIRYEMPQAAHLSLDVVDAAGRVVRRLELGERGGGPRFTTWDGRDSKGVAVASGIYFVRLRADDRSRVAKVAITR